MRENFHTRVCCRFARAKLDLSAFELAQVFLTAAPRHLACTLPATDAVGLQRLHRCDSVIGRRRLSVEQGVG